MIEILTISAIAIFYALIRAEHDSKISHGKWKLWAFIEGILVDAITTALVIFVFKLDWWMCFLLGPIFAFVFWIFFDCMQGYIRTGNILHIGTVGFDLKVRKAVKGKLWRYLFFKLFWLGILIGGYLSF
jgi:hypothetical protein